MTKYRGTAGSPGFTVNRLYCRLRDMLQLPTRHQSVTITVGGASCRCSECGLELAGDLREVFGHASERHGVRSFVLEEQPS